MSTEEEIKRQLEERQRKIQEEQLIRKQAEELQRKIQEERERRQRGDKGKTVDERPDDD